mmetsp:Transcript_5060/g.11350  ORF Transcript_5060/g.11350 Transcript_5060/m.11350 type:complete len:146 (-) Transcript_5060:224-661(-)
MFKNSLQASSLQVLSSSDDALIESKNNMKCNLSLRRPLPYEPLENGVVTGAMTSAESQNRNDELGRTKRTIVSLSVSNDDETTSFGSSSSAQPATKKRKPSNDDLQVPSVIVIQKTNGLPVGLPVGIPLPAPPALPYLRPGQTIS